VSSRSIDLRENMLGKEAMKDAQLGLWLADEQRAGLGRVADAVERSARDARSDTNTPKLWPKGTVKMSSAYRECVPSVRGSVRAGSVWFWTLIYSIGTKHEGERTEISGLLLQLENYQCMLEQR
jgi:hypothetical protein